MKILSAKEMEQWIKDNAEDPPINILARDSPADKHIGFMNKITEEMVDMPMDEIAKSKFIIDFREKHKCTIKSTIKNNIFKYDDYDVRFTANWYGDMND